MKDILLLAFITSSNTKKSKPMKCRLYFAFTCVFFGLWEVVKDQKFEFDLIFLIIFLKHGIEHSWTPCIMASCRKDSSI